MSLLARRSAHSVLFGSRPRSKRKEESLLTPRRRAVLRTDEALKFADSRNISVVASVVPELSAPMTPATQSGVWSLAEAMMRSSPVRLASLWSRSVTFPSLARHTRSPSFPTLFRS